VTGVQTCALPICKGAALRTGFRSARGNVVLVQDAARVSCSPVMIPVSGSAAT
jgi:hypothetical protein